MSGQHEGLLGPGQVGPPRRGPLSNKLLLSGLLQPRNRHDKAHCHLQGLLLKALVSLDVFVLRACPGGQPELSEESCEEQEARTPTVQATRVLLWPSQSGLKGDRVHPVCSRAARVLTLAAVHRHETCCAWADLWPLPNKKSNKNTEMLRRNTLGTSPSRYWTLVRLESA